MYSVSDFEVVDAHIHPFVDPEGNICCFGHPGSTEELFAELRGLGIRRACGSVIIRHPVDFAGVRRANEDALRLRDLHPDFYVPGIHVHGSFPAQSLAELDRMAGEGVRWVGELVPYIMGTGEIDSPGMLEICAAIQEKGMVVNVHGGDPDVIRGVAERFPELRIVMAHPGEPRDCLRKFRLLAEARNVFLDISGTGLFRWGMLRKAIDVAGAGKLLFGSDFPVCSCGMNLYGVLAEHLSREELASVLGDNFRRLVGMK